MKIRLTATLFCTLLIASDAFAEHNSTAFPTIPRKSSAAHALSTFIQALANLESDTAASQQERSLQEAQDHLLRQNGKTRKAQEEALYAKYEARESERYEREFMARHPDVVNGSPEYYKIAELVSNGVDVEEAYTLVFHGYNRGEQ